jgi:hypothetical protein
MSKKAESSLLAAARSVAEELSRFETLSAELGRSPITSGKSLQRARQSLQACSDHEAKLAESLRSFALAMQELQLTQQRCVEQIAQAAERIRTRQLERAGLEQRLQQLGEKAREVTQPVLAHEDAPASDPLGPLDLVERNLAVLIEEVSEVCELAEQQDWQDLTRETQSLREQLLALKNRVQLSRRKLAESAPS